MVTQCLQLIFSLSFFLSFLFAFVAVAADIRPTSAIALGAIDFNGLHVLTRTPNRIGHVAEAAIFIEGKWKSRKKSHREYNDWSLSVMLLTSFSARTQNESLANVGISTFKHGKRIQSKFRRSCWQVKPISIDATHGFAQIMFFLYA